MVKWLVTRTLMSFRYFYSQGVLMGVGWDLTFDMVTVTSLLENLPSIVYCNCSLISELLKKTRISLLLQHNNKTLWIICNLGMILIHFYVLFKLNSYKTSIWLFLTFTHSLSHFFSHKDTLPNLIKYNFQQAIIILCAPLMGKKARLFENHF